MSRTFFLFPHHLHLSSCSPCHPCVATLHLQMPRVRCVLCTPFNRFLTSSHSQLPCNCCPFLPHTTIRRPSLPWCHWTSACCRGQYSPTHTFVHLPIHVSSRCATFALSERDSFTTLDQLMLSRGFCSLERYASSPVLLRRRLTSFLKRCHLCDVLPRLTYH